ncbi:MAG: fibronectin type III domain-containing protein [Candidatus Pacebacteria bacterium]|nr:fibronectin type III domain-containing protein [Candidatus Paceibacterota bacterium]
MKKYFIIPIFFFLMLCSFCVKAQVSETDTVNISALVPESEELGGGVLPADLIFPIISDIKISDIEIKSANISWKTNELAIPQINYGRTSDYAKTFIGDSFSMINSIFLENLLPNTTYHFEITAVDRAGNRTVSGDFIFKTLSPFDVVPPANVINFTARSLDKKIFLNWNSPQDDDFIGVRINRNINFPALSIDQGNMIYSGNQESFEDRDVKDGIKYYYTAFSYDSASNFSSGAFVSAIGVKTSMSPAEPPILPDPPIIPPEIFSSDVENLETIPNLENKEIEIKWNNPDINDFEEVEIRKSKDFPAMTPEEGEVIYQGKESSFADGNIEENKVYYYTVFAKDKSGKYSAGKAVVGTLEKFQPSLMDGMSIKDISFIFSKEALLLPQRNDGKIYTFPNKEINIYYDSKNLPKTLKTIMITVGRSSYILNSDSDNKFYRTKFISPAVRGNYPIIISVLDFKHGKIYQTKGIMTVEDYGQVKEILSETDYIIWKIKNLLGFKRQINNQSSGAKITLYELNKEESWAIWNGKKFNQKNPQMTGYDGNFGFIVPNGEYKILVEKNNYIPKNKIIEVENNVINSKIEIKEKNNWLILIIVIAVLFVILNIAYKKIKRKKKNQEE